MEENTYKESLGKTFKFFIIYVLAFSTHLVFHIYFMIIYSYYKSKLNTRIENIEGTDEKESYANKQNIENSNIKRSNIEKLDINKADVKTSDINKSDIKNQDIEDFNIEDFDIEEFDTMSLLWKNWI